jgi:hypothetical protein
MIADPMIADPSPPPIDCACTDPLRARRVFGIDFMSVLTRGSQYRVESMLLRLAKAQLCVSWDRA